VGQTEVLINEGEEGITGVVIVCEGGNSILVKNDILNVVSTALNINKNIIAIYSM
jgi:stage III sporulation protein AG